MSSGRHEAGVWTCWRLILHLHLTRSLFLSVCLSFEQVQGQLRPSPLPPSSFSSVAPGSSINPLISFFVSRLWIAVLSCTLSPSELWPTPFGFRPLASPGRTRTLPDPLNLVLRTRLTRLPKRSLRCRAANFSSALADEWNKHDNPGRQPHAHYLFCGLDI